MLYLFETGQSSPRLHFRYIFDFCVCFQHQEDVLCHNQKIIDHLLARYFSFLACLVLECLDHIDLDLARKNATSAVRQPLQHVVVEPNVKTTNHFVGVLG